MPTLAIIIPGSVTAAFLQQAASTAWIGIYVAVITGLTTALVKGIDILNDRRKERRAEQEKQKEKKEEEDAADDAAALAERSALRLEERAYYQSIIERAIEERRIAGMRSHAFGNEVDRLRNQTLTLLQLWPRSEPVPHGVVIFNEDLNRILAEIEGLPLPPIALRPGSLGDPHTTSSPDTPASALRPPNT